MRVAIVDPRGDSRPYDDALGAALAARGHQVAVYTCRYRLADLPPAPGVREVRTFYRLADRLGDVLGDRVRRLARGLEHPFDLAVTLLALRRARCDVVHVQWLPLGAVDRLAWRLARLLLRRPLVHTVHNAVPKAGVSAPRQLRADCAPFDRLVTHSSAGCASLAALGVEPERIVRIRHGALDGYANVVPIPPAGIGEGVPLAVFVGLIRPYKGLDVLLDAWPLVRRELPDALLYVAGRPLGDPAGARAQDMRGEGVTAELRYVQAGEFAGALRRADCVVLPYRSIDLSGVLFTALALGRASVATDVGGLREVLEETGAGLVVPAADPPALAAAIVRVLSDKTLRDRLATAAAAAAAGPYAWSSAAAATEALYSSLRGLAPCEPPRS